MNKPWTDSAIRSLSSRKTKYRYNCNAIPGLFILVHPTGIKNFSFRYSWRNKVKYISMGRYETQITLADANSIASQYNRLLQSGRDPKSNTQAPRTHAESVMVKDAIDVWLETVVAFRVRRKLTPIHYKSEMRPLIARLGELYVHEVKESDIEELNHSLIMQGKGKHTIKVTNRCKGFFKWARKKYNLPVNPAADLENIIKESRRDRALNLQEIIVFLNGIKTLNTELALPYEFLLRSAQRKTEVIGMKISEYSPMERLWVLPAERCKNNRQHLLPLTELLIDIIEESIEIGRRKFGSSATYVFTGFSEQRTKLHPYDLGRAVKTYNPPWFGLPHWTVHDLRRTATTQMAAAGVPPEHRARVLNHTLNALDSIYNVYDYAREKHIALEALSERLDEAIEWHGLQADKRLFLP